MTSAPSILYEDHHLLVLNKPAPLLTQAPEGIPSLESWAKSYIKDKYAKPAGVYLGIPHRLDRPVSGIVVFCRNTKAAQRVHLQFHDRTVRKVYWAIVAGEVTTAETWEDWVLKVPEESRLERVESTTPGAKPASLSVEPLQHFAGSSLVALHPRTGRMHQLRAQCGWRGHPIWGDAQYGSVVEFGPPAEQPRDRVIALHARELTLQHPFRAVTLQFLAPCPGYWPKLSIS